MEKDKEVKDQSVQSDEMDPVESTKLMIDKMLEDAKKTTEEMIAQAKKEAAKIVKKANEVVVNQVNTGTDVSAIETHMNELVEVYLFKDKDKYVDDVFVSVNGKNFLLQRGKPVMVPRYVKEVLDNSRKQDQEAALYMETQSSSYEKTLK